MNYGFGQGSAEHAARVIEMRPLAPEQKALSYHKLREVKDGLLSALIDLSTQAEIARAHSNHAACECGFCLAIRGADSAIDKAKELQ